MTKAIERTLTKQQVASNTGEMRKDTNRIYRSGDMNGAVNKPPAIKKC